MNLPAKPQLTLLQWAFISMLLLVTVIVVFKTYFSLDEADLIWENSNGPGPFGGFKRFMSEGRPIYGAFTIYGLKLVSTVENLKYLRIISVFVAFASCMVMYKFLIKYNISKAFAILISVLIFTLPSYSVFMCWAECFPDLLSLIVSFYAGTLIVKAFGKRLGEPAISKGQENLYIAVL